MYEESPKRFDRIVAILIQLQSKKIVKAQEMADRFGVSLRTIYRDIRTLETSGVPICSEAGIGYSLVDGYRLPPVMFTREEAASFIAAEKLMSHFTDEETRAHHASAMYKLKSVLKSSEKDLVEEMQSKVLVLNRHELFNKKAPNALALIFRSIPEKKQVLLLYETTGDAQPKRRTIEAVGVFHEHNNWYVFGFCHLRQDYRQFRADRIHDIQLTNDDFTRAHLALEHYLARNAQIQTVKVVLKVDRDIVRYIQSDRNNYGFVSEKEMPDGVEMTFQSHEPERALLRWMMMFADCATIIEPDYLKTALRRLIEEMRGRHK